MANSASDARNAEYEIRKNIVDSGIVDCMGEHAVQYVFTVTLPATLWFFDKAKLGTERQDKILFLDARNVYHQIDRAHREWTEEQQQNLAAIVRLYRGEKERYLELVHHYISQFDKAQQRIAPAQKALKEALEALLQALRAYSKQTEEKLKPAKRDKLKEAQFFSQLKEFTETEGVSKAHHALSLAQPLIETPLDNASQIQCGEFIQGESKHYQAQAQASKRMLIA